MAKLYNLARMSTATTGTGTITLGSAASGYLTFALAGIANADVIDYAINDGANSEIGTGTYTTAGTTLTRTVTKSTNANAAINLSGSAQVFITPRAETLNDASLITTGTMTAARLGSGTTDSSHYLRGDSTWVTLAASATTDTTNASNISSGTMATARLGSGTANSTTALFGDQTYKAITTNGLVAYNVYTTTQTITIPAGATRALVKMCGPGGGSGSTNNDGGAGGGSGSYLEKYLTGLTAALTLALTIGAVGSAGSTSLGGNGGTSTLASGTQTISTLTANGGTGSAVPTVAAVPGGAGAAISTGGDLNLAGRQGSGGGGTTSKLAGGGGACPGGLGGGGGAGTGSLAGNAGEASACSIEWYS